MQNELFDFISKYMILNEDEKQAILGLELFHSFKKNTVLLSEGQSSNKSYFVLKGCIRCHYIIDGEERTTAFYTESEPFTPLCTTNNKPLPYIVACVEDSLLAVSSPDTEKQIFAKFPRFETLCRLISEDLLSNQQANFDQYKNSSPEQRYLDLLDQRPDLINRVPLSQLASFIGVKPESLSRIRKRIHDQAKA
jgi:CRP-like cAMP-binding protein